MKKILSTKRKRVDESDESDMEDKNVDDSNGSKMEDGNYKQVVEMICY